MTPKTACTLSTIPEGPNPTAYQNQGEQYNYRFFASTPELLNQNLYWEGGDMVGMPGNL